MPIHRNIIHIVFRLIVSSVILSFIGCTSGTEYAGSLFSVLPPERAGITFQNEIREDSIWNFFRYMNIYNGGGVAVGDINNDGLQDVYFTGNQVENKLYLNNGDLIFEDITETSGTKGSPFWTTGATIADVNADGWQDIYICQAGLYSESAPLKNLLFVNNGDLTFTEAAGDYGIADPGRSVHASFFDYDGDNDLDLYVLNHPSNFHAPLAQRLKSERNPNVFETDRLYRNNGVRDPGSLPVFTDVTDEAGVRNWAFGLSVTTADLNGDDLVDIYIGNDYSEPDHYWVNQGDGTFQNKLHASFLHTSNFSMGADAGDLNNDGWPDLLVVDMMAKDNRRQKTNMSGMNPETFWENVDLGRHYQYMQNVLQLNNGNGTFSDIAELAGVAFTDWSWSALFADLDNDGWKDIFITNGMRRDARDNDATKGILGLPLHVVNANWKDLTDAMPVEKVRNFSFKNQGDLTFEDQEKTWGLDHLGFTTGAALADLDNDGDLDMILNHINEPSQVVENKSVKTRVLRIRAEGPPGNRDGIGLKAKLKTSSGPQFQQLFTSRGFQSSSESFLHFGIPQDDQILELELTWPDGKQDLMQDLPGQGVVVVRYAEAGSPVRAKTKRPALVQSIRDQAGLTFAHREQIYDDYEKEVLLPHKYSQNGPMFATGDVNGDGLEDVFIGGAAGQSGQLFFQQPGQLFTVTHYQPWSLHAAHEDMGALLFDAEQDNYLDLYVASGSNEWPDGDPYYRDRLYLNEGNGRFTYAPENLPDLRISGSRVCVADIDDDGDDDLFLGGRVVPGKYPFPARSVILQNDNGIFKDVTEDIAPGFNEIGMVTDAVWSDYDQDGDPDLILCGEWMTLMCFENDNGRLLNKTQGSGLEDKTGWWYSLEAADIDGDGDVDFIAGNLGLNTKYKASKDSPFEIYADDFDANGKFDIVLGYHQDGMSYPVRGRQCSSEQMPAIAEEFPTYREFASASLPDIYGSKLESALHYSANWMYTSYVENLGDGTFDIHPLPNAAQLSPVNATIIYDIDKDGYLDLISAGNMFYAEVETCRHDASIGLMLKGNGKGQFNPLSLTESGFFAHGDVKDLALLKDDRGRPLILVARNDAAVQVYTTSAE